jgi:hypothetical protein
MKRFHGWMLFFAAEGGDGGGGSDDGGSGGEKNEGAAKDGDGGEGGEKDAGDDVSGLKSALEKERQAVKAMKAQLKELKDLAGKGQEAQAAVKELQGKLGEYEFKERRSETLRAVIDAASAEGFSVDAEKLDRLTSKLSNPETLESDVAEIVEILRVPAEDATKKKAPVLKGQPKSGDNTTTTDVDPRHWSTLRRTDPEAYDRMIAARRKGGKFSFS